MASKPNWLQAMANPYKHGVRKNCFELLQEKFSDHEDLIEKITEGINSDKDYKKFSQFIVALYEKGYLRAINEHKEQLKNMGYKAKIVTSDPVPDKTDSAAIFEKEE